MMVFSSVWAPEVPQSRNLSPVPAFKLCRPAGAVELNGGPPSRRRSRPERRDLGARTILRLLTLKAAADGKWQDVSLSSKPHAASGNTPSRVIWSASILWGCQAADRMIATRHSFPFPSHGKNKSKPLPSGRGCSGTVSTTSGVTVMP